MGEEVEKSENGASCLKVSRGTVCFITAEESFHNMYKKTWKLKVKVTIIKLRVRQSHLIPRDTHAYSKSSYLPVVSR